MSTVNELVDLYRPIDKPPTLHDAVVDRLRHIAGTLDDGAPLPPERDLCGFFEVSRSTLRAALAELAADGLLAARPGRRGGTFVTKTTT